MTESVRRSLLTIPLFLLLACLLLWPVVFGGQAFVPATLLRYVAPWEQAAKPPWNPLMYDSVGQFYPWRHFASEELRAGRIPLWNPYQFCGTPFVGNSQSAVFYPGNLLYWLMPTAQAAGWNVILHLCMAAGFMFAFLRSLGLSRPSAGLGGIAFAFSGWQVSWLALPTFLCTSCWLPLVLLCVRRLIELPNGRRCIALGAALGITLLAGHLQIAFYVALAALLLACWMMVELRRVQADSSKRESQPSLRRIALIGLSLVIAGMVAAPQLLPSLELSRSSHRAIPVSAQGYAAYTAYAVHPAALVTLFLPEYYGNPTEPGNPYAGASRGGMYFNYAEGAMYAGMPTLLLAAFALIRRRQPGRKPGRLTGYFGLLALLSLLMATGTIVDALFYFYVPGFGQSGSPGRSLILWSFALAALAAIGFEKLIHDGATPIKAALVAVGLVAALFAVTLVTGPLASIDPRYLASERVLGHLPRQGGLLLLSAGIMLALASGMRRGTLWTSLPVALVAVDMLTVGIGYNLTASPAEIYPERASLAELGAKAGHDRIMPVNQGWSFAGPSAILPPNGAMVFGLRDVQGYDSLFPGQYKTFMNELAGGEASPREVGNMVFARNPLISLATQAGVRFVLSRKVLPLPGAAPTADGYTRYDLPGATGRAYATTDDGRVLPAIWLEDDPTRVSIRVESPTPTTLYLADQFYAGWHAHVDESAADILRANTVFRAVRFPAGSHIVRFAYVPAAFRFGQYLAFLAAGIASACLCTVSINRKRG